MTTFILHGGAVTDTSGINTKFFQEIAARIPDGGRMLCCYFANPGKIVSAHEYIVAQVSTCTDKHIIFEIADTDLAAFIQQMSRSDVIYFHGGTTALLLDALRSIENLAHYFKNKIVIGSSAGAYMLSRYYYSDRSHALGTGLNILPIKVLAHYTPEHDSELETLKAQGEQLETYALAEGEFVVIEK
ncbi:MAG: Type 1 glutamine amidotransferase-like domain-containing protein [Candidatus Magasanikbacteria bacterium]|nr:Type 1 glutamine amidotransferase-like domain-containing protein [Candidatus Magasanikbacteria bacterium]